MTTTLTNLPATTGAGLGARAASAARRLGTHFKHRREYSVLLDQDDRMLRDMGVTRDQVRRRSNASLLSSYTSNFPY